MRHVTSRRHVENFKNAHETVILGFELLRGFRLILALHCLLSTFYGRPAVEK